MGRRDIAMRIKNGEGLAQGRGTVGIVLLLAAICGWLETSLTGTVGRAVAAVLFAAIVAWFVRGYFKNKRNQDQTWVQIDGTTLSWSTAPTANAAFTSAGTLDLREAESVAVVQSSLELKAGPRTVSMTMFAVQIGAPGGRTVVLPVTSAKMRVSVPMQRLVTALAAVPGIVPVDASALNGIAPAKPAGQARV